jgi:predicted ATP-grasp superfamily ATP-dependent carboligase
MYTGALENRRSVVRRLARARPLWGNEAPVLAVVRSPQAIFQLLQNAQIGCPQVRRQGADLPRRGRWLVKPLASAGGNRICFWTGDGPVPPPQRVYFQEYIEGDSCAAAFIGDGRQARLLGVTRQLVGERWLHAAPFHYCGSIGPLPLTPAVHQTLERMGNALVKESGMRGLFGVDCIVGDEVPWPVEINPRYTGSMEVLEYAQNLPVLALHRQVFDLQAPAPPASLPTSLPWIGKAILFAGEALVFPSDGPWHSVLRHPPPVEELPAFADVPTPGQRIAPGGPILTFFAQATSLATCLDALRQIAADLDRWLFAQSNPSRFRRHKRPRL